MPMATLHLLKERVPRTSQNQVITMAIRRSQELVENLFICFLGSLISGHHCPEYGKCQGCVRRRPSGDKSLWEVWM